MKQKQMCILFFLFTFLLGILKGQWVFKLNLFKIKHLKLEKVVFQSLTRCNSFHRVFLKHSKQKFSGIYVQKFVVFVWSVNSRLHVAMNELFASLALENHLICESKLKFKYRMWKRHPKEKISQAFLYLFFDTLTSELKESIAPSEIK